MLTSNESRVMINPTRVYSQNPSSTLRLLADSATIKFATEPIKVKLPARVEAAARVNQPAMGFAMVLTNGFSSNTAGTFDTKLLNTAVTALKFKTFS